MPTTTAATYAVWPTAWGPMGATAGETGEILQVVLPHYSLKDLKDLLAFENAGAKEDATPFAQLTELTQKYFNGQAVSFEGINIRMPAEGSFNGIALRACRAIPYGRTMSYSQLAKSIGREDAARAVATAMSKNKTPLVVPCHRVLAANGGMCGFTAPGGIDLKKRLLEMEKAHAPK